MVLRNLKAFKKILGDDRAVFTVYGQLSSDDTCVLVPDISDVSIKFVGVLRYFLKRLKSLPRWLRTSNIPCPIVVDETGKRHLYSYYDLVRDCQLVVEALEECYSSVEMISRRLESTLQK